MDLIARIDELGGAPRAIEEGFQQREIEEAAYNYAKSIDSDNVTVVGVNRFVAANQPEPTVLRIDPVLERNQCVSLSVLREDRDDIAVSDALDELSNAAHGTENVLYPMKKALEVGATIGDITRTLVPVFGRYRPTI